MSVQPGGEKSPYTDLLDKAFARTIATRVQFEMTYRCNHLCEFCYNAPTGQKEMTTPQIFEALRKIADLDILFISLTGGEPLCHKDFYKIGREIRRLGMAIRIYSNGFLMADPKVVRRIKEELNPVEIEISIHGARAETHEALTKIKGSFDKLMKALSNLADEGIKVNLKCPITRLNQGELFEIREIADRFGHYMTFDAVIIPKDDGNLDPLALRPDDEFLRTYWTEQYAKLHQGKLPPKKDICASDGSQAVCGTGRSGFTLDPYGNILPCVALRRKVANILEVEDLKELWKESPVLNEVRQMAVDARDRLDRHEDGAFFSFCMGVAETQTGDPLALYPQAEINARGVRGAYDLIQIDDPSGRKTA